MARHHESDRTSWDALITEAIPELGAEPDDIIIVRPEHPEYPVLVVKRYGSEAMALIREHHFRDRHDAHFILPVRQTIRPLSANMRIYYYTGPIDEERGRPTQGVLYMEDPLYDQTYEAMLGLTDPAERDRIARIMGDDIYDNYRTIPVVNIKATIVANPEVVESYFFGGVTGVFSHLEYAKAAR